MGLRRLSGHWSFFFFFFTEKEKREKGEIIIDLNPFSSWGLFFRGGYRKGWGFGLVKGWKILSSVDYRLCGLWGLMTVKKPVILIF